MRTRRSRRRLIVSAHGKEPGTRGQPQLSAWERGLVDPPLVTGRELAVLELLASDLNNHQIADTLGISYESVKSHERGMRWRTGLHTSHGLVAWAFRRGLVS